ncbi:MAG: hypothetical protein ACOC44_11800 [Promethearchaeia archaeon]
MNSSGNSRSLTLLTCFIVREKKKKYKGIRKSPAYFYKRERKFQIQDPEQRAKSNV